MLEGNIFINNAFNEAFLTYTRSKDKEDSLDYNCFISSVVRMLIIIYGEDIVKSFEDKDVTLFDNTILKYGYDVNELNSFKLYFDKFYSNDIKSDKKAIKKKNKFFNVVQKQLIDMMILKKSKETIDSDEIDKFTGLLFTVNSSSFYQKSVALVHAYNPYEIDEYAKKVGIIGG